MRSCPAAGADGMAMSMVVLPPIKSVVDSIFRALVPSCLKLNRPFDTLAAPVSVLNTSLSNL